MGTQEGHGDTLGPCPQGFPVSLGDMGTQEGHGDSLDPCPLGWTGDKGHQEGTRTSPWRVLATTQEGQGHPGSVSRGCRKDMGQGEGHGDIPNPCPRGWIGMGDAREGTRSYQDTGGTWGHLGDVSPGGERDTRWTRGHHGSMSPRGSHCPGDMRTPRICVPKGSQCP